jgi:pimeloyl-ACP methyl ester carboxylesterase
MIPEIARQGELLGERFDPDHIPEVLHGWNGLELDGNYARVAQTIHVEEAIDRYPGPVLVVHGDEDEAVPVAYGVRAAKAYANGKLALIPGDDHCYGRHLDQVVAAVQEWLRPFVRE